MPTAEREATKPARAGRGEPDVGAVPAALGGTSPQPAVESGGTGGRSVSMAMAAVAGVTACEAGAGSAA